MTENTEKPKEQNLDNKSQRSKLFINIAEGKITDEKITHQE